MSFLSGFHAMKLNPLPVYTLGGRWAHLTLHTLHLFTSLWDLLTYVPISSNRSVNIAPQAGLPPAAVPPLLTRMAPPVPPRQGQQTYRPSYSSFPSSYSPYGSSIYGGYSPYTYGGGYGLGGYNRLHNEEIAPSRFVQQAEESSRGAFQSIESIVQAFASVSMMMDATFSAVYNSFRAVLDVANHLTRLRAHLTRVLSAFALVRTLRYLYRRLLRLLGRRADSEVEDLWNDSANDSLVTAAAGMENQPVKSWPIFLFFAVVLGGPYLIWKLLSSSSDSENTGKTGIQYSVLCFAYEQVDCTVVCSSCLRSIYWH